MGYQEFRPSRFQFLPFVIKNLIIINAIVYLTTWVVKNQLGIDLTDYLGLHYFTSELFRPHQLVTYMFMHGNLMHIFFNMLALWMFGNMLENVWGAKRFLVFYFVTGIGAALFYLAFQWFKFHQIEQAVDIYINAPSVIAFGDLMHKYFPAALNSGQVQEFISSWTDHSMHEDSFIRQSVIFIDSITNELKDVATVGASGSVYGVLLGFGMLFPNTIVYMIFPLPFPIKAKYLVLIYGGLEVYLSIVNNPEDNVAHLAHLGGMLFAFILIRFWNKKRRRDFY